MSRGLLVTLVTAVLVLALGVAGLATYVFVFMPKNAAPAAAKEAPAKTEQTSAVDPAFYTMKSFMTNLADKDRVRYIDVTISLGLKTADSKKFAESADPQIRHLILTQIRSMSAAELSGPEGKQKLAEAVKTCLNDLMKDHLSKVYITDMVIQ